MGAKIINKIGLTWVAMGVLFSCSLSAQSTVSTPIVGFQKIAVPSGLSTAAFPMLNSDILKTSASSIAGSVLTLSGQSNVGSLLTSGAPYYIEIYSGNLKGDRFDVDTAATITSANGTVTLASSSANNTYPVASIGANLDNATIALRQHVTLDQIRASASPALVGNNIAGSADQVQIYNPTTKSYTTYFLRGDGTNWRLSGATTNGFNNVIIPPGTGVFIQKRGSSTELTTAGAVRQNDFARPYQTGLQMLASPYPMNFTAAGFGGSSSSGWTGNNIAGSADQIQIYNPGTKSYTTYFLRGDGVNWRRSGATTNEPSSFEMINSANGFFVLRRAANSNNILVNPIPN
jgi:hypothetical protein